MKKMLMLLICTVFMAGCAQNDVGSGVSSGEEVTQLELNENSFDFLVNKEKKFEYNKENNTLYVEYSTSLPDGTQVNMILRPSFPDAWGADYSKYSPLIDSMESTVELTVEGGKIGHTYGEEEFNGFLIPSASYNTVIEIASNDSINTFLRDAFENEEEFNAMYPKVVEKDEENPNVHNYSFLQDIDDNGTYEYNSYKIMSYDTFEVTDLNPIEEVVKAFNNDIPYLELEKNPEKYTGTKTKYSGEVLEIQESAVEEFSATDRTIVRLAVNRDYDQVILVTYTSILGMENVLKGDTVTIYGEITGTATYESVTGHQITIPSMETLMFVE